MESARTGEYIGWNQLDWRIYRMESARTGDYRGWVQLGLETIEDGIS